MYRNDPGCIPPQDVIAVARMFQAFLKDESGATAIEYSIIAGGIALAVITIVYGIGSKLNSTFFGLNPAEIGRRYATPAVSGRRNRHICSDLIDAIQFKGENRVALWRKLQYQGSTDRGVHRALFLRRAFDNFANLGKALAHVQDFHVRRAELKHSVFS